MRREPSLLRASRECGPPRDVLTALLGADPVALVTYFPWRLNTGEAHQTVFTVSDFRSLQRAALRSVTGLGWRALRDRLEGQPALVSLVDDNFAAHRLFSKKRPGWPVLRPLAQLTTTIIPLGAIPGSRRGRYLFEPSEAQLVSILERTEGYLSPQIKRADFGTVLPPRASFRAWADGAGPKALGALWDCSSYRQIVVASYGGLYAKLRAWGLLPPIGTAVPVRFVSFLRGQKEGKKELFQEFAHQARQQGAAFLVWGADRGETPPFPRWWPRLYYPSTLYQLRWDHDPLLPQGVRPCGYELAWL